jgi:hypothetical protein
VLVDKKKNLPAVYVIVLVWKSERKVLWLIRHSQDYLSDLRYAQRSDPLMPDP